MSVVNWMSWEGGIDLAGFSQKGLEMPNVIVHFARMVHTPFGSAPSGMLLVPNEDGTPKIMAFVSSNEAIGKYFASNIFAGTPFEQAPSLVGEIAVEIDYPNATNVSVNVEGFDVNLMLSKFDELKRVNRRSPNLPFNDDSLEAEANLVQLTVNGEELSVIIPPIGLSGGPAAVYSATGIYSR
ncbi:MAG: hypothetical protein ACK5NT_06105 [Pyrinomonadaceae bacterium]